MSNTRPTHATLSHKSAPIAYQREAMLQWARRLFREEGPQLAPRVGRLREGQLDDLAFDTDIGMGGLVQAAAVIARGAGPGDLVGVLSPSLPHKIQGPDGAAQAAGLLVAPLWSAALDLRTRGGYQALVMLAADARGNGVRRYDKDVPLHAVAHLGQWAAPGFLVAPWIEAQLAEMGVTEATSAQVSPLGLAALRPADSDLL